jgi:predicted DNA-binding transcriptional regulator YafY
VGCLYAATAIRACRRVRFAYQSHSEQNSRREINPYAVIHTDGRWYLIGYCLLRKALRTFRLDRVQNLEIRSASFQRPKKFDPHAHLKQSMPFIQSGYQIDVWIDMPVEQAQRAFAPYRVATESEQGGTRLRCGRDSLRPIAAMLLGMGRRIVIHKPAELRATFREMAKMAQQTAKAR